MVFVERTDKSGSNPLTVAALKRFAKLACGIAVVMMWLGLGMNMWDGHWWMMIVLPAHATLVLVACIATFAETEDASPAAFWLRPKRWP